MLSKEEIEKAKEMLNKLKDYKVLVGGGFVEILTEEEKEAIETFLQHIDQLEQENKTLKFIQECDTDRIYQLEQENDTQNKMIDEMVEQLAGLTIWDMEKNEPIILGDKEEVKKYFEKKVEEN